MTARQRLIALVRQTRAVAAVEFAIVAPVFLLATMGIFDLAHQYYVKSTLTGIVEDVGRSATLQKYAGDQTALDQAVTDQVRNTYKGIDVKIFRRSYSALGQVGSPERFTDTNGNGAYDPGECFYDSNDNRTWDDEPGIDGNGGADQVVLFTVQVEYVRIFPMWSMLGQPSSSKIRASTLLRNQPYVDNSNVSKYICE